MPILLRQYLKTGGKLLAFNVDRGFSHVLDALIMVDLRSAPTPVLERYFGKRKPPRSSNGTGSAIDSRIRRAWQGHSRLRGWPCSLT